MLVERGTKVKIGQPVVQLDVRSAALRRQRGAGQPRAATAQKQLAEQECQRTEELLKKGAITQSEYDRQMTQCTSTLQQVAAAPARADMMSKSVSDGLVRAPFDGRSPRRSVAPGEWVSPAAAVHAGRRRPARRSSSRSPRPRSTRSRRTKKVELTAVAARQVPTARRSRGSAARSARAARWSSRRPSTTGHERPRCPGCSSRPTCTIGRDAARRWCPPTAVVQRGKLWHAFVAVKGELKDHIVQSARRPRPDRSRSSGRGQGRQGRRQGRPTRSSTAAEGTE